MTTYVFTTYSSPPASHHERISDSEFHDPVRGTTCVLWRGRWIVLRDEDVEGLGELDAKLQAGTVGLRWEEAEP